MAKVGGQKGNNNATRGHIWRAAIERALKKRSKGDMVKALDDLAEKFLKAVEDGDHLAYKELGDRLDGKAHQSVALEATGKDGSALFPTVKIVLDAMTEKQP